MIQLKDGVDVRGLHHKLWEAVYLIYPLYQKLGLNLVITSALEGTHSHGSLHYSGMAIDIRTRTLISSITMLENIIDILPTAYDVILHATHIHIEYQPKNRDEI